MSNSIARPRRRPRVRSSSFRSFWWLVRHEGAFQILQSVGSLSTWGQERVNFATLDGRYVVWHVARVLHYYEGRRIKP